MAGTQASNLRFGSFEIDTANARLMSAGREVPLRPKSFDVLALLVANAGRVLGKEEILVTSLGVV